MRKSARLLSIVQKISDHLVGLPLAEVLDARLFPSKLLRKLLTS
jgi:hypothetical protein